MRWAFVLVIFLLLTLEVVNAQPASPTAIVPGRSIGPITIGMEMVEAKRLLAQFGQVKEQFDARTGLAICNDREVGLCVADFVSRYDRQPEVFLKTPGKVAMVTTEDQRFTGEEGLRLGMSFLEVLKIFGSPSAGKGMLYQWLERGLELFLVPSEGGFIVAQVIVFAPFLPQ